MSHKSQRRRNASTDKGIGRRNAIRPSLAPLLVIVVAFIAYANAGPNALVHDDKFFRGSERLASLSNIPRYFDENAWASIGASEPFYRPLLLTSITLDARIHGDWAAGYHLSNLALHALVSLLVFFFLRQLLSRMEGPTRADSRVDLSAALAVALIFAVHPVHTEVVNSVFNRSEMLVALAGLTGLIGFMRWLGTKPVLAWVSLASAFVFALFCKESAIMLPGIAAVLALAITPGKLTARLKTCLPLLLPAILLVPYLALRSQALSPAEVADTGALQRLEALANHFVIPDARRFMDVLGFWYEGIRVLVWPHPLSVVPEAITEPGRIGGLALNLALVVLGLVQAARKRYGLLTGLAIFYIASLPASRILGDPVNETHFSERYYYFPSIGLAIVLAFALRHLALRRGTRWLVAAVLPVMILFMPLTWARNAEWASDLELYQSDYAKDSTSSHILVWLTGAHLEKAHYAAVEEICDRHLAQHGDSLDLNMHCGVAYARQGRLREAEAAHRAATHGETAKPAAHANLARFYLSQDRWTDARDELDSAIRKEPFPARRALRTGEMLVLLYPSDHARLLEARQQFETALELQPALTQAQVWLTRVNQLLKAQPADPSRSTRQG